MKALYIAATGMIAQEQNIQIIANNIANQNTTAFKKGRVASQDLFYQNLRQVGSPSSRNNTIVPVGVQIGLGVRVAGTYRIHNAGDLIATGNTLDVAINGQGYFRVQSPENEVLYTRAGTFQRDDTGNLVTIDGYTLLPGAAIPPEATGITINRNGQVFVTLPDQLQPQQVGNLDISIFANEAGLAALGDNLYRETPSSGPANTDNPGADGFGTLVQGFIESSNVEAVEEITAMISAQRAYEMNSKVIETADQMLATASNIR